LTDPFELEARYYDKVWGSTCNYEAEAHFLHQILRDHGSLRILDLACGTGGHCLELAKLGYKVVGLDISPTMLEKARHKFSSLNIQGSFVRGDMTETHSTIVNAEIALPFDAVICMGYSFAHMLDDEMFNETLDNVQKVLKQGGGLFIFQVRNAGQLRDDRIRQLRIDTIVNEPDLQLVLLGYNFRDKKNPDILVWNALWLIKDHGKLDFQVRTHPLRWFRYESLERMIETHGYTVLKAYGDTLGREPFDRDRHDTIFMICQKT